jgi:glycosyltransferase involved in cell wall biosynthesis
MKILQMSTESSVQVAFILPLAQHLRKQGHQVALACSDDPGEAGQSFVGPLRRHGFEVLVLPMRRHISPLMDLLAVLKLYRFLRRRTFDVLHVQTAKAGVIGRIAARMARVPVVIYTAHAFPFHEYLSPWRMRAYAIMERLFARWCDVIVVDSESVKARGMAFAVAPPDHIRVIPMGIDTERFEPARYRLERATIRLELGLRPDALVIGALARFVPSKGLECLLHAVARLAQRCSSLQCLVVGDGPARDELSRLARNLKIDDRIVFPGYRTDVPRMLAAMDVYMLPTHREGFGVAFAEAMSMEIPVVASRIAPLTEIIAERETGMLAEVGDPEGFAQAAEPLLGDADLRRRMGQAGRRRVMEHFDLGLMCGSYETLFLECHRR